MNCSQCALVVLLMALVVGVQGHQIIYVDTENGTLDSSCWEGGLDQPCGSLELANTGAQRYNSNIAVVLRYGTRCNSPTIPISPQTLHCLPLPTIDNGTCRCEPTACRCNESATIQEYSSISAQSYNVSCPPWFEPSNGTCKCGDSVDGIVKCDYTQQVSAIRNCHCMTYNEITGTVVVGHCLYNCVKRDSRYHQMPKTLEKLNNEMCGDFNRDGQLCGECKANYSLPVYSYDLHCTMCSGGLYSWMKYVAIAFVPLTLFLFLVLCCRISATSPHLIGFVMFSQAVSFPTSVRFVLLIVDKSYPGASIAVRILLAIYGFWNLDFFRTLIPHICLTVDTLQALALDYGIAFYPLVLIIVTYVLIELHAHNCRFIVWIWKPFHRCFARFRQQWDIRTSTVDAFATFLLLSNVKLLSVSFNLLIPTYVYSINGTVVGLYLSHDASVGYFGTKEHLPYAIFALFVLLIFIIFPLLLLLLYPMQCFQRCLGCCGVRWHALHIFVDTFQGCYKDGTNESRDYRYFSGLYLLVRLILISLFAVTRGVTYYLTAISVLIGGAMLLAIFQPYKTQFRSYNAVDSVFILTLAMLHVTILILSKTPGKSHKVTVIVTFLLAALPLLYLVVIFGHWICSRTGAGQRLVQSIKSRMQSVCRRARGTRLEESLPDRPINVHLYHDDGDFSMANNSERFSEQAYSSIENEESTVF